MRSCFAVVPPGLERVAAAEMEAIGLSCAAGPGGVAFDADDAALAAANLLLRVPSRILVRLATFRARSFAELERKANTVPWGAYVTPARPTTLRVTCRKSRLYHSDAVAERLARAIVRAVPAAGGATRARRTATRDDAEDDGVLAADAPDSAQLFVVRVDHDDCTISADASGALLHRRGYRLETAKAPIRENLAAACLLALGYDGRVPLVDPMCGSGTFAIEAACIARRIAPGAARSFSFESWPSVSADAVRAARLAARLAARSASLDRAPCAIVASDRDAGAVQAARNNADRAGVAADIAIARGSLSAAEAPPGPPGLVIVNPPYGDRVTGGKDLRNLYAQLGNMARGAFAGWRIAIVAAERALVGHTRLDLDEVLAFSNGGIRVRLFARPAT